MKKKIRISEHEHYEGEVKDGDIPHGQGILIDEKRKVKHEGTFKDGFRDGLATATAISKDGEEIRLTGIFSKDKFGPDYGFYELPNNELYEGELKDMNYHGKGKYRYSDGMIKEGIFEKGEIKSVIKEYHVRELSEKYLNLFLKETKPKLKNDGEWIFTSHPSNEYQKLVRENYFLKDFIGGIIQDNCKSLLIALEKFNIKYDYSFDTNQSSNINKITYEDGSKYSGGIIDNKKHGQGTIIFANGDKFVGEWKNDKMHGRGTLILSNGEEKVGLWKDGELVE